MQRHICCIKKSLSLRFLQFRYKTYYEALGVPQNATKKEIRLAFLEKSKKLHPDQNKNDPLTHEKFVELNEAYTALSKPQSRAEYDQSLREKRPFGGDDLGYNPGATRPSSGQQQPSRPWTYDGHDHRAAYERYEAQMRRDQQYAREQQRDKNKGDNWKHSHTKPTLSPGVRQYTLMLLLVVFVCFSLPVIIYSIHLGRRRAAQQLAQQVRPYHFAERKQQHRNQPICNQPMITTAERSGNWKSHVQRQQEAGKAVRRVALYFVCAWLAISFLFGSLRSVSSRPSHGRQRQMYYSTQLDSGPEHTQGLSEEAGNKRLAREQFIRARKAAVRAQSETPKQHRETVEDENIRDSGHQFNLDDDADTPTIGR